MLFLVTIPASWVSTLFCLRFGGATKESAIPAVALMSIAALLLDGIAFAWFPGAYGNDATVTRFGAAWLLWAVGIFLTVAFWINRKSHLTT